MRKINHILFPIDFSERCFDAVPFVAAMARRYSAKITLLSVVQPLYSAMGDPGAAVFIDVNELLDDLRMKLEVSLHREFEGLQVDRVADAGDPARVITEFANTHEVDLIMMPTHGYGPLRNLLLGSVTAKVLHDAKCPVWTAAHVARPDTDHAACHDILCAVDGMPESESLMKWAGEFSQEAGATLRVVHVMAEMESPQEARETVDRLEESAGLHVPVCLPKGGVAEAISGEARRHDASLVVIGRGVLHETLGRLRTHAYGIIRQSPCPVLSV